jgi:hypothetical protein
MGTGDEFMSSGGSLPRGVRRDLMVLVQSEVFGERTAAAAARVARPGPRRDTWEALRELEHQTGGLVGELVAGVQLGRRASEVADLAGRVVSGPAGLGLGALPWRAQLVVTAHTTRPYLAAFQRLSRFFARPGERTFFDYVVDHELAIAELARRQLAGREDALAPVTALLGDDQWVAVTG